jgi:hypothetical protein
MSEILYETDPKHNNEHDGSILDGNHLMKKGNLPWELDKITTRGTFLQTLKVSTLYLVRSQPVTWDVVSPLLFILQFLSDYDMRRGGM